MWRRGREERSRSPDSRKLGEQIYGSTIGEMETRGEAGTTYRQYTELPLERWRPEERLVEPTVHRTTIGEMETRGEAGKTNSTQNYHRRGGDQRRGW